jgi:hypothetical protein
MSAIIILILLISKLFYLEDKLEFVIKSQNIKIKKYKETDINICSLGIVEYYENDSLKIKRYISV